MAVKSDVYLQNLLKITLVTWFIAKETVHHLKYCLWEKETVRHITPTPQDHHRIIKLEDVAQIFIINYSDGIT